MERITWSSVAISSALITPRCKNSSTANLSTYRMQPLRLSMILYQDGPTRKIAVASLAPLHGTSYSHSKVPNGKLLWMTMLNVTGKLFPITQDSPPILEDAITKKIGMDTNVSVTL